MKLLKVFGFYVNTENNCEQNWFSKIKPYNWKSNLTIENQTLQLKIKPYNWKSNLTIENQTLQL